MAISVDPSTFVIFVPRADMTLIQSSPTEVRELDTDVFRLALKAWEYTGNQYGGITFLKTHIHNTEVVLSGITYARTIEIIEPYTITFEDGQYAVNIIGSNNNIIDRTNKNQVSLISNNSAGLTVPPLTPEEVAVAVWDEPLTGANHNIPTSAGRRLRAISNFVITEGETVSATINTITLNGEASDVDGAYDPAVIAITEGVGYGQTRLILEYDGVTKTAVVDRDWKVLPDNTSLYTITANPGREHVNEGKSQGGTITTITLNPLASSYDDTYVGQVVFIRSGTGEDQACRVVAYNGTTKVATMAQPWDVAPDATSAYVMLPSAVLDIDGFTQGIVDGVWDAPKVNHNGNDTMAKLLQELYKLQGLDITQPLTITQTQRLVDDINLAIGGDGVNLTTVTRQP